VTIPGSRTMEAAGPAWPAWAALQRTLPGQSGQPDLEPDQRNGSSWTCLGSLGSRSCLGSLCSRTWSRTREMEAAGPAWAVGAAGPGAGPEKWKQADLPGQPGVPPPAILNYNNRSQNR